MSVDNNSFQKEKKLLLIRLLRNLLRAAMILFFRKSLVFLCFLSFLNASFSLFSAEEDPSQLPSQLSPKDQVQENSRSKERVTQEVLGALGQAGIDLGFGYLVLGVQLSPVSSRSWELYLLEKYTLVWAASLIAGSLFRMGIQKAFRALREEVDSFKASVLVRFFGRAALFWLGPGVVYLVLSDSLDACVNDTESASGGNLSLYNASFACTQDLWWTPAPSAIVADMLVLGGVASVRACSKGSEVEGESEVDYENERTCRHRLGKCWGKFKTACYRKLRASSLYWGRNARSIFRKSLVVADGE